MNGGALNIMEGFFVASLLVRDLKFRFGKSHLFTSVLGSL